MKAFLLCAGKGTRLQPITNTIPKPLVPINGKPLLSYWLENLSKIGIEEFLINTHYLHEQIEEYVNNSPFKNQITLVYENELLDTAGSIVENESFFDKSEPFMLIHADNLSFCDFKNFLDSHENRDKKCEITMMLFKTDNPSSCGIVELDSYGIVQNFHEKVQSPPSNLANGAVYICEPSIIEFLKSLKKKKIDFSNEVIPQFLGKINTFLNETYHRDIGTIESYKLANKEIKYINH